SGGPRACLERLVVEQVATFGPHHGKVAGTSRSLGALFLVDGDDEAAERAYRRAVDAFGAGARIIGSSPAAGPPIASALYWHAVALHRLGRDAEARQEERRQAVMSPACPSGGPVDA